MASTLRALDGVIDWLLRTNLAAAVLAVLILALNAMLRRRLPAWARYALLLLVAARLLMPTAPQSRFSVFNLLGGSPTAPKVAIIPDPQPTGDWVITKQPLSQSLLGSPTQLPTETSARVLLNWKIAAAALWTAGILLMAFRIVVANIKLSRRLRGARLLTDAKLLALLEQCKSQMRIRRSVPVLETDAIHSPALMGVLRPRLLLPLDLRGQLSEEELRFVFLHELAHLKRWDIAVDWCLAALQTLHWFNPLIRLAFSRARAERELARDAMVLAAATPREQTSYGQTIVKLVESFSRLGPQPGTIGILEANSGKAQLKRRITMIADFKKTGLGATILTSVIAAIFVVAFLTDPKATAAPEAGAAGKSDAPKSDPSGARAAPALHAASAEVAAADRPQANDEAAQTILDRRIPEVNFNAVALGDALEFLRDTSGANLSVNWKALAAAGIEKTAPVTIRIRNVKFSTALAAILADAGGDAVKLGFEINDGVIAINTAEEIAKNTEVQVYDVHDLLMIKDEKVNEQQLKDLTEVLQQNIEPASWAEAGGFATIKHLNGQLVITQTKANHRRVMSLLDKLRETRAIQISVQTHVIKASATVLKKMGVDIQKDARVIKLDGNAANPGAPLKGVGGQFLDDDQVQTLLKAIQATAESEVLTAPRVAVFNGQQATIAIGQEIPYITGWTALKDGKRDPRFSYAKTGFIFNVQGTVSADRKQVTMRMQPRIAELIKMDQLPWPQANPDEKLTVQKPDLAVQEVDETVSIPDGGTRLTVLGENDDKGKEPKGLVIILLVKPSVVIPREAEQPKAPVREKLDRE